MNGINAIMDSQSMPPVETSPISQLSEAAAEHGIVLTAEQARMGAEWRDAMLNSVNAVRQIDVDGSEPASAFAPVTRTPQDRGG